MRRKIAGPTQIYRGDTAIIYCRLRKGMDFAFVEVFSQGVEDMMPSPHVPDHKLGTLENGRPMMLSPQAFRLVRGSDREKVMLEIKATRDLSFTLHQQVDVEQDPIAIGRIVRHGRWSKWPAEAGRWIRGKLGYRRHSSGDASP